jgi:hypothetical protein
MRTFNTQITKQIAIGQSQGCLAVATGCERPFSAAQHLGLRHADRLLDSRRPSHLWHGLRSALVANVQNAWLCAANLLDLAADALTMQPTQSKSYRMPASAWFGMPMVGLVPVAVCRLPVAIATGTPMPRSADC